MRPPPWLRWPSPTGSGAAALRFCFASTVSSYFPHKFLPRRPPIEPSMEPLTLAWSARPRRRAPAVFLRRPRPTAPHRFPQAPARRPPMSDSSSSMSTTSPPWPPPPALLLAPLLDHDASSSPCATSTQPRRRRDGSLLNATPTSPVCCPALVVTVVYWWYDGDGVVRWCRWCGSAQMMRRCRGAPCVTVTTVPVATPTSAGRQYSYCNPGIASFHCLGFNFSRWRTWPLVPS